MTRLRSRNWYALNLRFKPNPSESKAQTLMRIIVSTMVIGDEDGDGDNNDGNDCSQLAFIKHLQCTGRHSKHCKGNDAFSLRRDLLSFPR